jgi:hypothetical protein
VDFQQLLGGLACLELRDWNNQIILGQRGGMKALQRDLEPLCDCPGEFDGMLLELVAFDERLTEGDEIGPFAGKRTR